MAVGADPWHRLVAAPIQVGCQQPRTIGIEGVELGKRLAAVRAGADFNGVGSDIPALVARNGRVQIQAGIAITRSRPHQIVIHQEGDGAICILARGHVTSITQIAHITKYCLLFGAGRGIAEAVHGFPFREGIAIIVRIDRRVIGSRIGLRISRRRTLRVGKQQKTVRPRYRDDGWRRRRGVDIARATATATA